MKIEHKVVPVVETKVIDEEQGIVGAFVSVTGVVDSVKDRIIPGAYEKTLKVRTPKTVWSHDWDTPVGKTLVAEELFPGDERLPSKTRNAEDWPAMAGALYVETQFNLDTQRGREAFSDVKFYGEDQEWSIGYNVPPGASKVDSKTGVRELSYIDLYEYSPVLFGAMSLTQTAGFKDAQEAFRAAVKAGDATPDMVVEEERDGNWKAAAATLEKLAPEKYGKGGLPEGTTEATNDSENTIPIAPVAKPFDEVTDDTPITTPADPIHQATPGHTGKPAGVEVEPRPTVEGPVGDAEVSPAKSAAFVGGLSEKGQEAWDALGDWAEAEAAKDGADLAAINRELQDRTKALLADHANYAVTAVEEGKAMVTLTGSYEERINACQRSLRDALGDVGEDLDIDLDESDDWGYPRWYVTTEATFNNRVVAAAYDMNGESPVRFFEAGYAFDGQQSTLKNVREVRLEATVASKAAERGAKVADALLRFKAGEEGTALDQLRAVVDAKSTPAPPQADEVAPEADEAPDAAPEGEFTVVTLSEADLLMLERLKLSA